MRPSAMVTTFTTTATMLGSLIRTVSPLLEVAVLLLASSMTTVQRLVTAATLMTPKDTPARALTEARSLSVIA